MTEDEGRDKDVDDLFGDLDEFFAPIDDVDWPEEPEGEAAEAPGGEPDDEDDWAAPEFEIPGEDELLGGLEGETEPETEPEAPAAEEEPPPPQPEPEVPEPEVPEPEVPEPEVPEPEVPVEAEADEDPALGDFFAPDADEEPEEPAPPPEESAAAAPADAELESTAEMSGEDWERLRGALGEGDEDELGEGAAVPTPSEDLSVEDLARAPEQYAELPSEESPEAPDPDDVLAEEAIFETEEPLDAAPPSGPEEDEQEDVEAAAAHFASGLEPEEVERDLLSDLGGEPPPTETIEEPAAGPPDETIPAPPSFPEAPDEEPLPLGGAPPTWQEPAAYAADEDEVAASEPAQAAERNLTAAIASGAILAAAALALLAIGKGPFVVLAVAIVLLGQGELYAVLAKRGFQPATAMGLIAGLFVMVGAYTKGASGQGEAAMLFGLMIGTVLSILWYMAAPPKSRRGLVANVAATMFGVAYVPFLVSFALLLLAVPGQDGAIGRNLLLTVVGLTVLYDVTAYAIGTLWGNRPLAPTVSPRKSWEGAIGATFVVLFVALAIVATIDPFNAPRAAGLALVISIAAPLGDLAESAIKRDLGVKDMGSLLPGHGGVLDRIDAILFTAPAAYYFVRLLGLIG